MEVKLNGRAGKGIMSKDVILSLIGTIGTGGAIGHIIEFRGEYVDYLNIASVEVEVGVVRVA